MRHGQGSYTYASGDTYTGAFKDGEFNGQGTKTAKDGTVRYTGEWKDGLYNGQGTMTDGGKSFTGEWKNGERVR